MTWKPLLAGELAREAEASVRAIASALEPGLPEIQGPAYSSGHAGIALFHGYFAAVHGDDRSLGLVETFIGQASDGMAENAYSLGFFGGISGIAWTCHHLDRLLTGEASPDTAEEVDQAIAEGVRVAPWTWHYDLVYGLAGIGRYALDHPDRAFAAEVIRQIIQRLGELAVERDGGLTWLTPNARIPAGIGQRYPDGFYNLGLAHGVPGLIAMLGGACEAGLAGDQGRHLLEGAVTWLLANRRPDDGGSAFTYYLAPMERADDGPSSRSGWCYGDPGVAAALLGAARSVGDAGWEREAIAIAAKDCARSFAATGVVDAELCHGTAGLGHLYNRLYQATGEETFARAARGWFERTLSLRRPDEGVGGYLNWWPEIQEWKPDPGFLTGSAGVGLALLAAISPVEPGWDGPMMLSLAPRPAA
jgi:lantibiotic modifying enzyme